MFYLLLAQTGSFYVWPAKLVIFHSLFRDVFPNTGRNDELTVTSGQNCIKAV